MAFEKQLPHRTVDAAVRVVQFQGKGRQELLLRS